MRIQTMSLAIQDPEVAALLAAETDRQQTTIELIASENYTSETVLEALGSVFTNKYAEGLPGKRYYGGTEVVDKLETLCIQRALAAFQLDANEWGCNVQPYSGSVANMAVYLGLLKPGDCIMGLDLPSGGHLSHGYQTAKRKVSAAAQVYRSVSYKVNAEGWLDYDAIEDQAIQEKPALLICGASAYSRDWNYNRFRAIANKCGAILMADMAHTSGLIAAELLRSPFSVCDIVTTTTHKTLRGPRSAIIFYRKKYEKHVQEAVFPGLQGGPHMNQIAAVAVQMAEVQTLGFRMYQKQVTKNAQILASELKEHGCQIVTGGTDNHLFLLDLRSMGLNGAEAEARLGVIGISVNKNTIPGDSSALKPSGIRIGTPAITTRGATAEDMRSLAGILYDCLTHVKTVDVLKDDVQSLICRIQQRRTPSVSPRAQTEAAPSVPA